MLRKLRMLNSIILLLSICFSGNLFAQNHSDYPQQTVNLTLTSQFLNEVNLNCSQYTTQEHIDRATESLSRIVFHEVPAGEYPECPLLSSLVKRNKCNPGLDFSIDQFDPSTFNPLKYFFRYSDTESNYYRVDGQNYIIEIKPKN